MKRMILVAAMLLFVITAKSQNEESGEQQSVKKMPVSYCMSYEEFKADSWQKADDVQLVMRSEAQVAFSGGGGYKFVTGDKEQDKLFKKKVFAVIYGDTLYVNLKGLKHKGALFGSGYAHAYRMTDGRMVFTEKYISRMKNMSLGAMAGAGGVFVGLLSGVVIGAVDYSIQSQWPKQVAYLVASGAPQVTLIDHELLPGMLSDHPELLKEYDKVEGKKEKRSAAIVMPLLIKAGAIKLR